MQSFVVKNDILFSMYYLRLATLFNHAVPVFICEMFCFHMYDLRACSKSDLSLSHHHLSLPNHPVWKYRNRTSKKFDRVHMFTQFIDSGDEEINVVSAVKLSQNEFCHPVNRKIILSDLLLFKSVIPGVRRINMDDFKLFILSMRELFLVRGSPPS